LRQITRQNLPLIFFTLTSVLHNLCLGCDPDFYNSDGDILQHPGHRQRCSLQVLFLDFFHEPHIAGVIENLKTKRHEFIYEDVVIKFDCPISIKLDFFRSRQLKITAFQEHYCLNYIAVLKRQIRIIYSTSYCSKLYQQKNSHVLQKSPSVVLLNYIFCREHCCLKLICQNYGRLKVYFFVNVQIIYKV